MAGYNFNNDQFLTIFLILKKIRPILKLFLDLLLKRKNFVSRDIKKMLVRWSEILIISEGKLFAKNSHLGIKFATTWRTRLVE